MHELTKARSDIPQGMQRSPGRMRPGLPSELQLDDVRGLRTAGSLNHFEFDALTFVQRLVAVADDRAEVHEYIMADFRFDKAEAFLRVEPFYFSLLHEDFTSHFPIRDF